MTTDNLYVYGIVADETFELDVAGVNGAEGVRTITFRNLGALVSDIDTTDPEQTDENAQAHDEVLRAVLEDEREPAVVPMQFGMAFESARTVKNVLRGSSPAFRRALSEVEGSVELGVKIVGEEGGEIDRETAREAVDAYLADLHMSRVENDLFSDRLLVNDAYLVEQELREAFGAAVADLRAEFADGAKVQYTGPWAPYNFVEIDIGARR